MKQFGSLSFGHLFRLLAGSQRRLGCAIPTRPLKAAPARYSVGPAPTALGSEKPHA